MSCLVSSASVFPRPALSIKHEMWALVASHLSLGAAHLMFQYNHVAAALHQLFVALHQLLHRLACKSFTWTLRARFARGRSPNFRLYQFVYIQIFVRVHIYRKRKKYLFEFIELFACKGYIYIYVYMYYAFIRGYLFHRFTAKPSTRLESRREAPLNQRALKAFLCRKLQNQNRL